MTGLLWEAYQKIAAISDIRLEKKTYTVVYRVHLSNGSGWWERGTTNCPAPRLLHQQSSTELKAMLSPFMAKRSHLVPIIRSILQGLRPKKKDDYLENPPENHRGAHNPPTIREGRLLVLASWRSTGSAGPEFDNRELVTWVMRWRIPTLQEINISPWGKRKIIFKYVHFWGDMLVPRRVLQDKCMLLRFLCWMQGMKVFPNIGKKHQWLNLWSLRNTR